MPMIEAKSRDAFAEFETMRFKICCEMWCDLRARNMKSQGMYFEGDKFSPETVWSHGVYNGWLRGAVGKELIV